MEVKESKNWLNAIWKNLVCLGHCSQYRSNRNLLRETPDHLWRFGIGVSCQRNLIRVGPESARSESRWHFFRRLEILFKEICRSGGGRFHKAQKNPGCPRRAQKIPREPRRVPENPPRPRACLQGGIWRHLGLLEASGMYLGGIWGIWVVSGEDWRQRQVYRRGCNTKSRWASATIFMFC